MYPNLPVGLPVDDMVKNLTESYKDNLKVFKDDNMARLMVRGISNRILDKLKIEVLNAIARGITQTEQVMSYAEIETINWWKEVHRKADIKSIPEEFAIIVIGYVKKPKEDENNVG